MPGSVQTRTQPIGGKASWAILLGAVIGLAVAVAPVYVLPGLVLLLGLGLFLWYPAAGLGLLLLSRSSLDAFSHHSVLPGPGSLNPAGLVGIVLIVGAVAILSILARGGHKIEWGGKPALLWALWILFSGFGVVVGVLLHGGMMLGPGIRELIRLTSFLALYLLVVNLARSREDRRVLIWAMLLGLVIPAVIGFQQVFSGETGHDIYGIRRIPGTFVHPNPFATYLTAMIMVCIGFWRDLVETPGRRFILIAAVAVALCLMIFTYSRAAIGILIFSLILWGFSGSRKQRLLTIGTLVLGGLLLFPWIAWRFQDLIVPDEKTGVPENSFAWRLINYRELLHRFSESPIVGHGIRSVNEINPMQMRDVGGYKIGYASHNEFIRVLAEQGTIGALVYLGIVVALLVAVRKLIRQQLTAREGGHPGLGTGLLCHMGAMFLLSAIGTSYLDQTVVMYLVFTFIGVLYVGRSKTGSKSHALSPTR